MNSLPLMYTEIADWWPVLSAPEDYAEEAGIYRQALLEHGAPSVQSVLELGCGGGSNASHLKAHFAMTLVDLSPGMLAVSRALNPGCEHVLGDMRAVRLDRTFDAVFVHDAVMYMTTPDDLLAAMTTAFVHCRPGGCALFVPDHTRETYEPRTDWGGHDRGDRAMRYLEWSHEPDPRGTVAVTEFAYILHENGGTRVLHDRHEFGLFARADWLRLLADAGFDPVAAPYDHSSFHDSPRDMFVGRRPA